MNLRLISKFSPTLLFLSLTTGCAVDSGLLSVEQPSIAHAHFGHALTAWFDTPDEVGLFVAAERAANQAAKQTVVLHETVSGGILNKNIDKKAAEIAELLSSEDETIYTLEKSLKDASKHMQFASQSPDASQNMIGGAIEFEANTDAILQRVETFKYLVSAVDSSQDIETVEQITQQMRVLAVQILEGVDEDNDGYIGNSPIEYGLKQLRRDMAEVAAREDSNFPDPFARVQMVAIVRPSLKSARKK
jgi:hypothetical protein